MLFFRRYRAKVLLVCTANICRSPMAEWILRSELNGQGLGRLVGVESAGTHVSMPGRGADPRAQQACKREGIKTRRTRARQINPGDFASFDHILAMEMRNYDRLLGEAPEACRAKISLLGAWVEKEGVTEIPDPYYGNQQGFSNVYELLQLSCRGFVAGNLSELASSG